MTSRLPRSGAHATRVVVLGTGTSVGKTFVTQALAQALRSRGASVVALKPIETGVSDSVSDASTLALASSEPPGPPPFVFHEPVSPHLAARRSSRHIQLPRVVAYVEKHENEMTRHVTSFVLVESAGGCLSPLGPGLTNTDFALALEPSVWILVAPDALGVLHDVSATLAALAARGRLPDHVVLSAARDADASTGTNASELATLGIVNPIATVGRGDQRSLDDLARKLLAVAPRST